MSSRLISTQVSGSIAALAVGFFLLLSGCTNSAVVGTNSSSVAAPVLIPAFDGKTGPLPAPRHFTTDVLIYDGTAAAYNDDDSIQSIVTSHGLTFRRISSDELNALSLDELATYGAIVWPGGYASEMNDSLTGAARERIREAVLNRGVGFMGICAGAWMAVGPSPTSGGNPDWGLSIIPGAVMREYMPSGVDGIEMTPVKVAGQSQPRDMVWYGGPALPEIQSGVMARYKDGTPAMVQTWAGHGFVVLTSPHPEAPQIWRDEHGLDDTDGTDFDLAIQLIKATLDQQPVQTL